MTGYTLNKIAGAVLAALLLFFGSKQLVEIFWADHAPEKPGYDVPVSEEVAEATGEEGAAGEAAAPAQSLGALLAAASPEAGANVAKKCAACHAFEAGAGAKIGPNLHGVVGRDIASMEGFQYSPALSSKEGQWTYENLNHFIEDPKAFAPGTIMVFPGIKDAKDRADVIVYLRSISPDAPPLPAADAPAAPEGEAAAPAGEAAEGQAAEQDEQQAAEEQAAAEAPAAPAEPAPEAAAPDAPVPAQPDAATPDDVAPSQPEQPAPAADPAAEAPAAAPAAEPAAAAAGDAAAGEKAAAICKTCHAFEAGAPNKIGPNLHGVFGRDIASVEGFSYSPAMKDKEGVWDQQTLDAFIANPRAAVPGTKMIFGGIKQEGKRQDLIAYLKSISQ